ncbi:cytochrome b562 [Candidatus Pantoea multigeneris]|uniref:Cytochrome b562 n=1 Tax=Candidatus Pantoea multigeneris TaxID=2608357 RepID=A0ABX0RB42_9GAMM|nr:cytochrome b562 [Pantoea multigeneris]NIF22581.1 cytochrome b562 [Pantoea multigeneris]
MRKPLLAMLSITLLFSSASLYAADLKADMHTLKDGLGVVQKSSDAQAIQKALAEMRTAAEDAKKSTPETLEGKSADSAEVKDYHAELDKLIAQIDVVDAKAKANDLAGVKEESKKLETIRNEGHKKFR